MNLRFIISNPKNWTIEQKTSVGFAIAALFIVVVGFIALQNSRQFSVTRQLSRENRSILDALETLYVAIISAENAQQGYLMTNNPDYIEDFRLAIADIEPHLYELSQLLADSPLQSQRLNAIRPILKQKQDELQLTLDLQTEGDFNAVQELVSSNHGKELMDTIRDLLDGMRETENTVRLGRSTELENSSQTTLLFATLLTVLSFGALLLVYYLIHQDITGRKQAIATLEIERNLLHSLMDSVPDTIYYKDAASRFTRVNRAHAQFFGVTSPDAVIGKTDFDFHPAELAQAFYEEEQQIIKTGQPLIDRLEFNPTADGQPRWFSATKVPIRDKTGQVTGLVGISRNETEREQVKDQITGLNEELVASNKYLEAFSYSISHDLRAPLRAIDSFSRIVMDKYAANLPDEGQKYLQRVRNNTQKMGNLIDDLLLYSRLSRKEFEKRDVKLNELVKSVLDDLKTEQGDRQVDIVVGELPNCQGDVTLLTQVFANLLGNAIKYTRPKPDARIEINSQNENGERIYYVKDNGVGFDMQYSTKLFGVFQRLHTDREFEGTGVGLAIVQHIIERHNGRIWAEAALNQGATFYFTLGGKNG